MTEFKGSFVECGNINNVTVLTYPIILIGQVLKRNKENEFKASFSF